MDSYRNWSGRRGELFFGPPIGLDRSHLRTELEVTVPILASAIFGLVNCAARKGRAESSSSETRSAVRSKPRCASVRGETWAHSYLRRNDNPMIARNFTYRGIKREIDLVGFNGATIRFAEGKPGTSSCDELGSAEDGATASKQRHLSQIARQFVRECRAGGTPFRSDILAIEALPGKRPVAQLRKGAFSAK